MGRLKEKMGIRKEKMGSLKNKDIIINKEIVKFNANEYDNLTEIFINIEKVYN